MAELTLVALTNCLPGTEAEYEDWLVRHHLPDVLAVEGVTSAQQHRFVQTLEGVAAQFRYCALYTATTPDPSGLPRAIIRTRMNKEMTDTEALASPTSAHWYEPLAPTLFRRGRHIVDESGKVIRSLR